jgi:hypothetical protein
MPSIALSEHEESWQTLQTKGKSDLGRISSVKTFQALDDHTNEYARTGVRSNNGSPVLLPSSSE